VSAAKAYRASSICPSRELLHAFGLGKAPAEMQDAIAEHLSSCASCVEVLDRQEDEADRLVAELRQSGPPEDVRFTHRDVFATRPATSIPERIGRYRVERVLGQGSFGIVYLAQDEELSRPVAIKVPHFLVQGKSGDTYLAEARTVANLDHPNIVPVYDIGSTAQFPCFWVSKYIDGIDLATRLTTSRLTGREAAELTTAVADALHYAHQQGLVHRDVKPGNLLLDKSGKPFVTDFGLVLRERSLDLGPHFVGTPAYMSPEQARGEGHRVDGRSDIFSLGAVLYELLTGKLPFPGDSRDELLLNIATLEVRPPRQWNDQIPRELERICLKALAKRASDRYTTARDFAEDLRHYLSKGPLDSDAPVGLRDGHPLPAIASSYGVPVRVVPKGLRSFDAGDAEFFLELLPGPRDREGLPDSLRFWKSRIEAVDPDQTFAVGLIYGPSGCGKSSLVKAGLLPRLAKSVRVVYVEAAGELTEARLLKGLRRQVPQLPAELSLSDALAELRRGKLLEPGQKVLLVLDQFEQWLHARRDWSKAELVQALRQCDGGRVQCVVLVRDDFWMGATRFMRELEIPLLEGQNALAVDLFDLDHARKVLAAFGRAFGKLAPEPRELSKEQKQFLEQVLQRLASGGKLIPVRLALFAEMVKSKPWTPGTLRAVGGAEGVGVAFLEETFTASTAPPSHRLHQKAAQAVLKALLPEPGIDLKGFMRPQEELLTAAAYTGRPAEFIELLNLLDGELRLITPAELEEVAGDAWRVAGEEQADPGKSNPSSPATHHPPPTTRFYQLTHDYLVPSLRDWLTRKQKETKRGRAELMLEDRASVWNLRRENRQLPSLLQWWQIRRLTRPQDWTGPQRELMQQANGYYRKLGAVVGLLSVALVSAGLFVWILVERDKQATRAAGLVHQLLDADIAQVPAIVRTIDRYREWTDPLLQAALAEVARGEAEARTEAERRSHAAQHLHASLGLLSVDVGQVTYLHQRLFDADPREMLVLRDALFPYRQELRESLWKAALDKGQKPERLRAACALAIYDSDNPHWKEIDRQIAADLVAVNLEHLGEWRLGLSPARSRLMSALAKIYREADPAERNVAGIVLAHYAADQPALLMDLFLDADEKQFAALFPKIKDLTPRLLPELRRQVSLPANSEPAKARSQTNAAIALVRLGEPELAWPVLKFSADPTARSFLVDRMVPFGADPQLVIRRLKEEQDVTVRRALLLSLREHRALLPTVRKLYREEPDPGLHGAAAWLLRQWSDKTWLEETDRALAREVQQRNKLLASKPASARWYVDRQRQTMVLIPGPVKFMMGSPVSEKDHYKEENLHREEIPRTFAIAAYPVTVKEYLKCDEKYAWDKHYCPELECPAGNVLFYKAAVYCNYLSKREGIPEEQWCYDTSDKLNPKLRPDHLQLTGYRLLTSAEWEYACRASTETPWYFGAAEELLGNYGWFVLNAQNRTSPVGVKMPNDLGLFDMHGNAWCWTQEQIDPSKIDWSRLTPENKDRLLKPQSGTRVMRGGSFSYGASGMRSASFGTVSSTHQHPDLGFRVARTLPIRSD
jgi:serine/threonine protein kinase/formylglycine-generating enzyme required for sulfatase activity